LRQLADEGAIEVPGVGERGPRMLSRQTLAEVIEPRVEELYSLVQAELRRSGFEDLLSSGIVITGAAVPCRAWSNWAKRYFICRCGWVF